MLSQTAEYAMRAALCLARHHGEALTTLAIAEEMQIPSSYLSKVLQFLGRARIVRSQRGQGGGFVLLRDPAAISLLDVMDAVDPIARIERCPLEVEDHCLELCPLHRRLDDAIAQVREAFGATTLGELLVDETRRTKHRYAPAAHTARQANVSAKAATKAAEKAEKIATKAAAQGAKAPAKKASTKSPTPSSPPSKAKAKSRA